ncbi:hypothetical protein MC885_014088 [Smutsia gigantea]|nr:hypothetical protein MC885_014088 [Smutsia gigantea]
MADETGVVGRSQAPKALEQGLHTTDVEPLAVPGPVREKAEDKEWIPITNLGRLVKDMKVKSLEEICLFSLPTKESKIIDFFLGASLKDEVLKIKPVQKQTHAGQWTRFKVFVASEDYNGHVGLDEVLREGGDCHPWGPIILAKLSIIPVK